MFEQSLDLHEIQLGVSHHSLTSQAVKAFAAVLLPFTQVSTMSWHNTHTETCIVLFNLPIGPKLLFFPLACSSSWTKRDISCLIFSK